MPEHDSEEPGLQEKARNFHGGTRDEQGRGREISAKDGNICRKLARIRANF